MKKKTLITGAAGFIGFHLARRLLSEGGHIVVGVDNLNDYYDVNLKQARIQKLKEHPDFRFQKIDLVDRAKVDALFMQEQFDYVVNLAAQAGVRLSLVNPYPYIDSNVTGFLNILEGCRAHGVEHLVFASSSSVYGASSVPPYSVEQNVDHPISLYAATKKANELMAHSYAHLYGIPTTGLRFFNVYGPWGRPDAAYFIFTKHILESKPIKVFNYGRMRRDFTYVADIVEGVARLISAVPTAVSKSRALTPAYSWTAPYRLYNIGNNQPEDLLEFIHVLERILGKKAELELLPIQPGDVPLSHADVDALVDAVEFSPSTSIQDGLKEFVDWYLEYYEPIDV